MKYPFKEGIKRTRFNARLYDAALKYAVRDISLSRSIEDARRRLIKWEAFRSDSKVIQVINILKERFKNESNPNSTSTRYSK